MISEVLDRVCDFPITSTRVEKGRIRPAILDVGRPSTYGARWD